MKLLIIIFAALGAFFGWHDFSHHKNLIGTFTVTGFALAIVIVALAIRKRRRIRGRNCGLTS